MDGRRRRRGINRPLKNETGLEKNRNFNYGVYVHLGRKGFPWHPIGIIEAFIEKAAATANRAFFGVWSS